MRIFPWTEDMILDVLISAADWNEIRAPAGRG